MGNCSFFILFCKTLFNYPSCVFWASIINPIIALIISYFIYFSQYPFDLKTFPIETFLFQCSSAKFVLQLSGIVQTLFTIIIFFFVRRFFIKAIRSAAPLAKVSFEKYTKLIIVPMVTYIISFVFTLFIDTNEYKFMYLLTYLISIISYYLYIFCFNQMNMIKEGKLHPIGYGADIVLIISFIVFFPLLLFIAFYFNYSKDSPIIMICAVSKIVFNVALTIKNILVAFTILENKFSKLQDNII